MPGSVMPLEAFKCCAVEEGNSGFDVVLGGFGARAQCLFAWSSVARASARVETRAINAILCIRLYGNVIAMEA